VLSAWCRQNDNARGAVEFLLLAAQRDEAFRVAAEHDCVDVYVAVAQSLADGGAMDLAEHRRIAEHFENRQDWANAGKHFAAAGDAQRALRYMLRGGPECIPAAIQLVGQVKSDMLTHSLLDFLTGEADGQSKDPIHVFQLYLALGRFESAAFTGVVIARQEAELGNFAAAHAVLVTAFRALVDHKARVSSELLRLLELLHSYTLVKRLVKQEDHTAAAKMLQRVAADLSRFPTHVVPILTSAVIECQRAGFKRSAHALATMLMAPERKDKVEPALLRKIEGLVRRPSRDEAPDDLSPCPHCATPISAWDLDCPACRAHLPMCLASGQHLTLDEWTACPHCSWPAMHSYLVRIVAAGGDAGAPCPMCDVPILPGTIPPPPAPPSAFRNWEAALGLRADDAGAATTAAGAGAGAGAGATAATAATAAKKTGAAAMAAAALGQA
jgi:WD repeat-containing protein 19